MQILLLELGFPHWSSVQAIIIVYGSLSTLTTKDVLFTLPLTLTLTGIVHTLSRGLKRQL